MSTKIFLAPARDSAALSGVCERRREYVQHVLKDAEAYRREQPSVPTRPLVGVLDYATATLWVQHAMHHLDEALPMGQKERGQAAFIALVAGAQALGIWMSDNGYEVPNVGLTVEVPEPVNTAPL